MPSEKVLEQKKALVSELTERLKNSVSGVVVNYKGITVEDDTKLRKDLREAGVNYTVVKNTMLLRAAKETGLDAMESVLEGTTALATCEEDYAAPARILCKYADAHENFTVKTGFIDNDIIEMDKIVSLSKLPTRDVLLANVLGAFQAPIASFARAVQAIVDKGGAEAAAPTEEAATEEAAPAEAAVEETTEA